VPLERTCISQELQSARGGEHVHAVPSDAFLPAHITISPVNVVVVVVVVVVVPVPVPVVGVVVVVGTSDSHHRPKVPRPRETVPFGQAEMHWPFHRNREFLHMRHISATGGDEGPCTPRLHEWQSASVEQEQAVPSDAFLPVHTMTAPVNVVVGPVVVVVVEVVVVGAVVFSHHKPNVPSPRGTVPLGHVATHSWLER
jgi:hypothetical protein